MATMLPAELQSIQRLLTEAESLIKQVRQCIVASPLNLPAAEAKVVQLLDEHGPISVPQLARLRATSRQNIQVLVNRLVKEGLVEFADNPAHKRSPLVILTEAGKLLPSQARAAEQEVLDKLVDGVQSTDLEAATALLSSLRSKLATAEPPRQHYPKHLPQTEKRQVIEEEMPVSLL